MLSFSKVNFVVIPIYQKNLKDSKLPTSLRNGLKVGVFAVVAVPPKLNISIETEHKIITLIFKHAYLIPI